ncbi:MAG TPA: Gfo/Idh/MocA family oxidoreductase [Afifellaceae bacterium]|nr:Gfo/Idh/MocA family oxidoreductase [Afifellaceae bacterium]
MRAFAVPSEPIPQAEPVAPPLPRTVVVGGGYWGRNVIRSLADIGALHGVVDSKLATAAELAAAHGGRPLTWEAALADPQIEAVAVATPPISHFALAQEALLAGKHVLVEKPLALGLGEAEELVRLADSKGLQLGVGHQLQYHPAYLELRRLVRDGAFGRLRHIAASRLNFGKVCQHEDALWALGPHDISMILGLSGEEPAEVRANGHAFLQPGISDVVSLDLRFASGLTATIRLSWAHPFKEQRLVIVGDDMMAVFDDVAPWPEKLVLYSHRVDWTEAGPVEVRGAPEPVTLEPCEPLKEECRHMLERIRAGERPRTDGHEGLRVLAVIERASAALASG